MHTCSHLCACLLLVPPPLGHAFLRAGAKWGPSVLGTWKTFILNGGASDAIRLGVVPGREHTGSLVFWLWLCVFHHLRLPGWASGDPINVKTSYAPNQGQWLPQSCILSRRTLLMAVGLAPESPHFLGCSSSQPPALAYLSHPSTLPVGSAFTSFCRVPSAPLQQPCPCSL